MMEGMKFKQTIIDWARLKVALRRFAASLRLDITNDFLRPMMPELLLRHREQNRFVEATPRRRESLSRPEIYVSYATDESLMGSHKYCGGEKVLNNLVLLLRRHGYEAFMVTLDGRQSGWLVEHAPCLSLEDFISRKKKVASFRCVTSWIRAKAFLDQSPEFYFWDQELGSSARSHFPELSCLMTEGRIVQTAGVNRIVQTWHTTVFGRETHLLRQLLDERHWHPDPARRIRNRVGYFDEGEHGEEFIRVIEEMTRKGGLDLEFYQLEGLENEIISQMQTCAVCLVLNIGKSSWGEGGPMTPWEAMACGAVPVCFDLKGAWEVVAQDHNGIITEEIRPELMAEALLKIYGTPECLEAMSRRALDVMASGHTLESRWPAVRRFLDLPEENT